MTHYADPTVLHPAECRRCGLQVRDADELEDGLCAPCEVEERDDEEPEDTFDPVAFHLKVRAMWELG